MKPLHLALCAAALLVSACASEDAPFSNPDGGALAGVGSTLPPDGVATGDLQDPTSLSYFQQTVGDRILFEVDQSSLTATARQTLTQQAAFLTSNPSYTALVEGHADERGTRAYNVALGARRAASVRDFLVSQGVAESRLRTVSYGKERPLEVCSQEQCYIQNRRAVTALIASQAGL